jgi:hypothetical protein
LPSWAIARTVSKGSATVIGTGRSSRISRCRHFARLPCRSVLISAVGVISVKSGVVSIVPSGLPASFADAA